MNGAGISCYNFPHLISPPAPPFHTSVLSQGPGRVFVAGPWQNIRSKQIIPACKPAHYDRIPLLQAGAPKKRWLSSFMS